MSTIGYYICVPFAWLVRLFYNLTNSYGVALILFTLVIKLIMLPFQMKSKKSMMRMSRVSGQMQELQKRYAKNQAKLQEEMQKLYEEEGVNPMSGCLWGFLPLPILMALYSIIRQPITHFMMLSKDVLQSHERLPLELFALSHPDCSVLHHPPAYHPFHDAAGIRGGDFDPNCYQRRRQHG